MIKELKEALLPKEYEKLPASIKASYTPQEWLWLSSLEKANLVQTETEPDKYPD